MNNTKLRWFHSLINLRKTILKFYNHSIGKFIKKCGDLKDEIKNTPAYQIIDIRIYNGNHKLIVQINGTGKSVSYFPHEIAADDIFLEQFSIQDIRTILVLSFEEIQKPLYSIVSHKFCGKRNKIIFRLRKRQSSELLELSASELSIDKDIIKKCSPEDAHRVGFCYGSEKGDSNENHP